jgi:hypothetical protein
MPPERDKLEITSTRKFVRSLVRRDSQAARLTDHIARDWLAHEVEEGGVMEISRDEGGRMSLGHGGSDNDRRRCHLEREREQEKVCGRSGERQGEEGTRRRGDELSL